MNPSMKKSEPNPEPMTTTSYEVGPKGHLLRAGVTLMRLTSPRSSLSLFKNRLTFFCFALVLPYLLLDPL